MKSWLAAAVIVASAVGCSADASKEGAARGADHAETIPFASGDPAPDIEVVSLKGERVRLSSLRGKVVLLDFWASWCAPCIEGLPITDKLYKEFKGKGLVVLPISDEDAKTVAAFVKKQGYSFTPYLDPNRTANAAYKIEGIPTTVVIDPKGKISSYTIGLDTEENMRAALALAGMGR